MERTILIIDDDPRTRRAIMRALRSDGYSFIQADSIVAGLAEYEKLQDASVILLELEFPESSGTNFLQQLGPGISKHRVIVFTAHEEYLAATEASEYGVFRYLPKSQALMESLRFTVAQAFKDIEAERLKDKNRVLVGVQGQINSSLQETDDTQDALTKILNLIATAVCDLVGAYTSHIRVYNLNKGDFHLAAFAGYNELVREIFALPKQQDEPFSGIVAARKHYHYFPDLQNEPGFQELKERSLERMERLNDTALLKSAQEYFDTVKSAFMAPITTHLFADETDAVFTVSSDSLNFFSEEKRNTILEFVGQATTAITKAWLKQRKHASQQDYRGISHVLEDMSRELLGEEDKSRIYDTVIDGIAEIIRPEAISIFIYNKLTGLLDHEAEFRGSERYQPSAKGHPTDAGLTALVFSSGTPLRVPNLQINAHMKPYEHPHASKESYVDQVMQIPSGRVEHFLAVPMIVGNERIGAIQLLNKKSAYYGHHEVDKDRWLLERGFSDDCENVLGIAANHLAVKIRNAELLAQQRKQFARLAILRDVGRFTSSDGLDELLERIITEAAEGMQAELCLLFLLSQEKVVLRQCYGIQDLAGASYEIGEGFTGGVVQTAESVLLQRDVPLGKYDQTILQHLQTRYGREKQIESMMIVPIMARDQCLGVIKVINKKGVNPHYDLDDLKFFEDFASYVGLAIENQQRYDAAVRKLSLAEGNATLSNMVRAVLHEINNTQALIPANIQVIKERLANSDFDILPMINVIEEVSSQTLSFANNIQAFEPSRLKERKTQDINAILQKALQQLIPTLKNQSSYKHVEVDLSLSEKPLRCAIYETPFIQVIRNIILNAFQSMEKNPTPRLRIISFADSQRGSAVISFTDTGCGIRKEDLPQIFDPGFTTKGTGTGIGLWLAKRHLESIDASITVTSTVNQGTTFQIAIPLSEFSS